MVADFPRSAEDAELDALIVHDLRSPLSAIRANLGFLRGTPAVAADASSLEALQDVESSALTLQQMIDNFSMLSILESGPVTSALEAADLHAAVSGCLERLRRMACGAEVPIVSFIAAGTSGPRVLVAPKLLSAAIDNLLQAAIRHTPRGEQVQVSLSRDADAGIVEVRDGSPPVPAALAADLFTRAGQCAAKRHPTSRYGRGLGLVVAGLAVHACGGTIEAVERDGRNAYRVTFKAA